LARKPDEGEIIFRFFSEVGIIGQLSSTLFNRRLPDGLHVSHFSVLSHLSRRDFGETPLQLADAFQVSKGTMSHTLGVLVKRGFVRLQPHETDGRSKIVSLTDEGRDFQQQAIASLSPGMAKLAKLVDVDVLRDMLPELETIRVILDENRDI